MKLATLVHPDAPELEFTPSNSIEDAAYKSQGFVDKDAFFATQPKPASDEAEALSEKLAKETEKREAAEKRADEAEAKVEDLKKELKTERAKNTRDANKAAKGEDQQAGDTASAEPAQADVNTSGNADNKSESEDK